MARQLACLSDDERARHDTRRGDAQRAGFRVAHALLRTCLSRHGDRAPDAWRFAQGEHGRPELADPPAGPRLRFSLSHTTGLVACALALEHDVGVDVEAVARRRDVPRIAERMFTPREQRDVLGRQGEARTHRFLAYWTLKEAHLKALGTGMTRPMKDLEFSIDADGERASRIASGPADDTASWWYRLFRVGSSHQLAVALRCDVPARFEIREAQP